MNASQFLTWLDNKSSPCRRPLIMGVLNVTPDSFSDGNMFHSVDEAYAHGLNLIEQGADLIDIGGESTRPMATPVPLNIELTRVLPVIERLRKVSDVCISIDTYKAEVMQAAVFAGADMINDIYALRFAGSLEMASRLKVPVCLMHMQKSPRSMQAKPQYPLGVVSEVLHFFKERLLACEEVGFDRRRLMLDPGFGFGKLVSDNLSLIKNLQTFKQFDLPILLGVSRKSTIGAVLNKEVHERLVGSIALEIYAVLKGVELLRVHDVAETKQALMILEAVSADA